MRFLNYFILAICTLFVTCEYANSQTLVGLKGGANLTKGVFEDGGKTDFALKYHFGFLARIAINNKISISPEITYSAKGWKIPDDDLNQNAQVSINYLNLNTLFEYKLGNRVLIYTGPEIGLKINQKKRPNSFDEYMYRIFDFGLSVGAKYSLTSKIGIDLRYIHGFRALIKGDLYTTDSDGNVFDIRKIKDGRNRVIQFGFFYLFNGKE